VLLNPQYGIASTHIKRPMENDLRSAISFSFTHVSRRMQSPRFHTSIPGSAGYHLHEDRQFEYRSASQRAFSPGSIRSLLPVLERRLLTPSHRPPVPHLAPGYSVQPESSSSESGRSHFAENCGSIQSSSVKSRGTCRIRMTIKSQIHFGNPIVRHRMDRIHDPSTKKNAKPCCGHR
jgi:hypothetical protein